MNFQLQRLRSGDENARRDAAMELGRAKASQAIDALTTMLASDQSPAVRDAAARALGLIASPRSLTPLIHAAQADNDRDVRHSAQFAVEIIRTNLKR
jgi:HEAT repeat protein